jgi:hypothetical protein
VEGKMKAEPKIKRESFAARSRWIAVIALLVLCAIPQMTSAQQPKKKMPVDIAVTEMDIQSLSAKLDVFGGQLSREELGAMNLLLRRAASAPADHPGDVNMKASFFASGPAENNTMGRQAIVIQGGKTANAQVGTPGGRPANNTLRASLGGDTDPLAIGPKHEDPMPAPDTINALDGKLRNFGGTLSPQERGVMDWLLQRASAGASGAEKSYGTPGGRPPTLFAALGTRKTSDSNTRWLLHF